MTGLVDTHAHLTSAALVGDVPGVLARAGQVGVSRVITVGTDVADTRRAVELAEAYPGVWATAGIHPHEAAKAGADAPGEFRELLKHPRTVAIGEIGLDYHYDFSDRASQRALFAAQLDVAADCDLPLVIHCREAVADTVAALHERGFDGRRVVFHCFTGTADEAGLLADHGWRISFTGIVTFRQSSVLQGIAKDYPAEQLMLETDAPYLSPEPVRKVRPNEPAFLRHTAEFLARLRGRPVDTLMHQTTRSAEAFFRLPAE
ncbi:MAG: TatD family hydrolase [Planctomycetota bacterium]